MPDDFEIAAWWYRCFWMQTFYSNRDISYLNEMVDVLLTVNECATSAICISPHEATDDDTDENCQIW